MPISISNNPRDFYLDVSAGLHAGEHDTLFTSSYQTVNSLGVEAEVQGIILN